MANEKELEKYYRKEPESTEKAIKAFLRDSRNPDMVVFGGQAINAYLPDWLERDTKDWDILTEKNAKELASKLEAKLDKHYGGDYFGVEPAVHEGTYRIKSKITGEAVADISLKEKEISFKRMQGINYASLEFLENEAERITKDPESAYRHKKDNDTLQRIKVYKKLKKKTKRRSYDNDLFPAFRELR